MVCPRGKEEENNARSVIDVNDVIDVNRDIIYNNNNNLPISFIHIHPPVHSESAP